MRNLNREINSKVGNLKGNRAGIVNSSKRTLGDARNKSRQSSNQVSKMHFRAGGSGANRVNVGMSSNDLKKAYAKAKRMNDVGAASIYSKELAKRSRKSGASSISKRKQMLAKTQKRNERANSKVGASGQSMNRLNNQINRRKPFFQDERGDDRNARNKLLQKREQIAKKQRVRNKWLVSKK